MMIASMVKEQMSKHQAAAAMDQDTDVTVKKKVSLQSILKNAKN